MQGGNQASPQVVSLTQTLQLVFEQASTILRSYGIEMYIYKVKLRPDDCSKCIDYIVRIECASEELCEKLREVIKREQAR